MQGSNANNSGVLCARSNHPYAISLSAPSCPFVLGYGCVEVSCSGVLKIETKVTTLRSDNRGPGQGRDSDFGGGKFHRTGQQAAIGYCSGANELIFYCGDEQSPGLRRYYMVRLGHFQQVDRCNISACPLEGREHLKFSERCR